MTETKSWQENNKTAIDASDAALTFPGPGGPTLAQAVMRLHLMTPDDQVDDGADAGAFTDTDSAVQVIRAGTLKLTTFMVKAISAGGAGLAAVSGGLAWFLDVRNKAGDAVTTALVAGALLVVAATVLALALVVSSDLQARGVATAARVSGRADVAAAFLRGMATVTDRGRVVEVATADAIIPELDRWVGKETVEALTAGHGWRLVEQLTKHDEVLFTDHATAKASEILAVRRS